MAGIFEANGSPNNFCHCRAESHNAFALLLRFRRLLFPRQVLLALLASKLH